MMNSLKSLAFGIAMLASTLVIFSNCDIVPVSNLNTLQITYTGRDTFDVKSGSAAGTYSVNNQVIMKNLDDFLKKAGVRKQDIATVRLDSAVLTIPQNNTLMFDALEEGSLSIIGFNSLGSSLDKVVLTVPKRTGKETRLIPTIKETFDVRKLVVGSKLLTLEASLKTNRATPASQMYLRYWFTIGYQILQ